MTFQVVEAMYSELSPWLHALQQFQIPLLGDGRAFDVKLEACTFQPVH